jgi:hypothetical protein
MKKAILAWVFLKVKIINLSTHKTINMFWFGTIYISIKSFRTKNPIPLALSKE